jgi:anthranilate 3-monooxygenase (FAD)/4-hydroxyphenylacetate 3-monooxygenase
VIRTGEQYMDALRAPREVYVGGERVEDVTTYAPFRKPIESYARLYDRKHNPEHQDVLSYVADDGERYDISFMVPKSKEDLKRKGRAFNNFSAASYGCLGRGPESMAALVAGLSESADWFEQWGEGHGQKITDFCNHVRDNDLFVTHALGNPQSDRSKSSSEQDNPYLHLRMKEETPEGLIIRGAKQLATAAPFADEVLVFPNGRQFGPSDEAYAMCFAIPADTPGLKILCREPLITDDQLNVYDHPLSSRYEEIDALLVFDDVLVPWDRVFFHNNLFAANNMRFMTAVAAFSGHLSIHRAIVRSGLAVATAMALTESAGTNNFPNVGEIIGRITAMHKAAEALLFRCEEDPRVDENGTYYPNSDALTAHGLLFPDFYVATLEAIKRTGAAGLMLTPMAADFHGEAGDFAETYFAGVNGMTGSDRVQIGKLAWDLAGSPIGQRLAHYERFYIGEPMFVANFYSKLAQLDEGKNLLAQVIAEGKECMETWTTSAGE